MFSDKFVAERPPGKLEISMVLAGAFGAIGRRWPALVIVTLALYVLPFAVTQAINELHRPDYSDLSRTLATLGRVELNGAPQLFFFHPLFSSLCAWIIWADASRTSATLATAFRTVAPRLPWIIVAYILVTMIVAVGFVLLAIPGFMASMALWVVLPICAVEGLSPLKAISRSVALTRGHRWSLFGLYLIMILISLVLSVLMMLVSMMAGFTFEGVPGPAGIALRAALTSINALFAATCFGSAYVELRGLREGVAMGDAAAVFA